MGLWTDIIDPATLTGYTRASIAAYEARKGSLDRWLPNRYVADIVARFVKGQTGLIDIAKFRAYDAPPEIGAKKASSRVTIELPAIGQDIPVSEYDRLRAAGGVPSDNAVLQMILSTTDDVVRAIADGIEYQRGIVLNTGKATINQDNFLSDDDFGRPGGNTITLGTLWTLSSTDRLAALTPILDLYEDTANEPAGAMVMSTRAFRALSGGDQFKTVLVGGATRPATLAEFNQYAEGQGMPPIFIYNRRVAVNGVSTKVVPDDRILLLPAPVDPNDHQGTDLGATVWGRTLSSLEADWAIEDVDQPGIVAGVWKNDKVPHGAEILGDAIGMPVLANAEKSMSIKVL
jgi:hypothetical protein